MNNEIAPGQDPAGVAMNRLTWLIANCHSVALESNEHRCSYVSVADEVRDNAKDFLDVPPEVLAECIRRNELLTLQIYPDTPVGFMLWRHYDLEALLSAAYAWAVAERGAPVVLT